MEKNEHELLSSFALNALTDAEREEVLRYAATSDSARQELDDLQDTAAQISLSEPAIQPPDRLKASIMNAIQDVEQLPPTPLVQSESASPASDPHAAEAHKSELPRGGGKSQKFFALAAGVLLLAAGSLGAVAWNLNAQQKQLDAQMQAISGERDDMRQIMSAPDMKSKSQTLEDGATVRITYSAQSGLMAVSTAGMPELPEGKAYELWIISDKGAASAGMIHDVKATETMMIAEPMQGATHFGITVEPASGSPTPTTQPIMLQTL
ncbi:hypothetical protein AUR04nite_04540 [Glutamicibacter uratoxydans]|uniref:Regulator of SigK n=1 Tax=Glutamicibacter uratoxydans TaxID=43667 RepID=A0A4Y4DI48_GLUUR|nr:anti-sigma factor [Glutamicibacter uratoxydans]GED04922.1 hypothetical protein AUR04nite_04540 [Glutamicibacter uratoxydans]